MNKHESILYNRPFLFTSDIFKDHKVDFDYIKKYNLWHELRDFFVDDKNKKQFPEAFDTVLEHLGYPHVLIQEHYIAIQDFLYDMRLQIIKLIWKTYNYNHASYSPELAEWYMKQYLDNFIKNHRYDLYQQFSKLYVQAHTYDHVVKLLWWPDMIRKIMRSFMNARKKENSLGLSLVGDRRYMAAMRAHKKAFFADHSNNVYVFQKEIEKRKNIVPWWYYYGTGKQIRAAQEIQDLLHCDFDQERSYVWTKKNQEIAAVFCADTEYMPISFVRKQRIGDIDIYHTDNWWRLLSPLAPDGLVFADDIDGRADDLYIDNNVLHIRMWGVHITYDGKDVVASQWWPFRDWDYFVKHYPNPVMKLHALLSDEWVGSDFFRFLMRSKVDESPLPKDGYFGIYRSYDSHVEHKKYMYGLIIPHHISNKQIQKPRYIDIGHIPLYYTDKHTICIGNHYKLCIHTYPGRQEILLQLYTMDDTIIYGTTDIDTMVHIISEKMATIENLQKQ